MSKDKDKEINIHINNRRDAYAYWLDNIYGLGNKTIRALLAESGSAETIYGMPERELQFFMSEKQLFHYRESIRTWNVEEAFRALQQKKISFYHVQDERYPDKLREIPDAPFGIYVKGKLPEQNRISVAVIGARMCSEYGRYMARQCGMALAREQVQVISGLASGIDGISQKGALDAGGDTFSVLGCGVDICYPENNRALYEKIPAQGGIISEYPLGMQPLARNFPPRNRIISGLADIVLVIEAKQKSGTLITVDMALEQGREVLVLPGRVTDSLSAGCNRLIKQGAGIILSCEDLLAEVDTFRSPFRKEEIVTGEQIGLSEYLTQKVENKLGKIIIQQMDFTPQSLNQILEKIKALETEQVFEISLILQQLVELQIRGMIQQAGGYYSLCGR